MKPARIPSACFEDVVPGAVQANAAAGCMGAGTWRGRAGTGRMAAGGGERQAGQSARPGVGGRLRMAGFPWGARGAPWWRRRAMATPAHRAARPGAHGVRALAGGLACPSANSCSPGASVARTRLAGQRLRSCARGSGQGCQPPAPALMPSFTSLVQLVAQRGRRDGRPGGGGLEKLMPFATSSAARHWFRGSGRRARLAWVRSRSPPGPSGAGPGGEMAPTKAC